MSQSRRVPRIPQQPAPEPAPEAPPSPWARQAAAQQPRATKRERKLVDGLPDWEPLPPGEILVRRHRQP
ncbi:hypothetical protein [Dactylosporangium sp. CA-139066]|uniref:hypothetical protein n=1 Tax=Dactylosporangium sp. CA-139066 TaxID=3239930 RepID=UPI003D8B9ECB